MRYIHQEPGWPEFSWSHARLIGPLAKARLRQGMLLGRMTAVGLLRQEADLDVMVEDVAQSSLIEGELLAKDQIRSSIARRLGMEIAGLPPAAREVEGVVEMMLDATQNYERPLDAERLFAWHASLFPTGRSGMRRIIVGDWRRGPMEVVSGAVGRERVHFEAPEPERVPEEMGRFLKWFESDHASDPLLKAAIAHLWFETIHPFEDGNGRIGRAVMDLAMARSDQSSRRFYSMSSQFYQRRNEYYATLEQTQKGDLDITEWLLWFLAQFEFALNASEKATSKAVERSEFWAANAETEVNARQRKMLDLLLAGFEGSLTTGKYAKIAKCSNDTALRDIVDLIEKGILKQNEGGGRSTSYSLVPRVID